MDGSVAVNIFNKPTYTSKSKRINISFAEGGNLIFTTISLIWQASISIRKQINQITS